MQVLNAFCSASGMKVNFDKSRALCSKNVSRHRRDNFTSISAIRFTSNLGKYLGVPLIGGRVTKTHFQHILDNINTRLAGWKGRLLNRAGRICLAKSVLASIPIHQMQVMALPSGICDAIDRRTRLFIWNGSSSNRSFNLVNWKTLIAPKRYGGLGVKEAKCVNISLLGKLAWKILIQDNSLWVRILSHKYLDGIGFNLLSVDLSPKSSPIWRAIMFAVHKLREGFSWGVDCTQSLWYDSCFPFGRLCELVDYVHISDSHLTMGDLCNGGTWNISSLWTSLSPQLRTLVQDFLTITQSSSRVGWFWQPAGSGLYSAASAYRWLLFQSFPWDLNLNWSWIWKVRTPEKVKVLLWLCIHGSLPTNSFRFHRSMAATSACSRCGQEETLFHCLRDCFKSRSIWNNIGTHLFPQFEIDDPVVWLQEGALGANGVIFLAALWWIWRSRNQDIFHSEPWSAPVVARWARLLADDIACSPVNCVDMSVWHPPPHDAVKLNVDGSVLWDQGLAGFGCILRDSHGGWLASCSGSVDEMRILRVELEAVYHGLSLAWMLGFRTVYVDMDCLEAFLDVSTDQISPHHLDLGLLLRIRALTLRNWSVHFDLIPRTANRAADHVAKTGAASGLGYFRWHNPGTELNSIILVDLTR